MARPSHKYCCCTKEFDNKVVEHTQRDKVRKDEEHAPTSQNEFVALACAVFERQIQRGDVHDVSPHSFSGCVDQLLHGHQ